MSFWRNYYHLIWATKDRHPLIFPDIEKRLYGYLVSQAAEMGVYVYAIGGIEDHVHVVAAIPPKQSVAKVIKQMKGSSSHFMNTVVSPDAFFSWQRGYGCLTLGEKWLPEAEEYVRKQKDHHADHSINTWLERCEEVNESPLNLKGD